MEEIWKDIDGFQNFYQISNFGRIKSFKKESKGKILKNTNKNGDYFSVVLKNKNKTLYAKIHRLVAEAFIPNPNNLPCVNHIDGNKQNNKVENLEWVTYKENFEHSKNMGLWKYNYPYKKKKVIQYDLQGNFIQEFDSSETASKITGVCSRNILQVASKEPFNKKGHYRKQAGGYIWRFAND